MNPLIPVTIVTGFLGSGKTTLLASLIKKRQSRRLALLINEFGEVSIDGALIRDCADENAVDSEQIKIHDFPHGLIAYGDDALFIPTMKAIAARRAQVDHVLIETSGLALPTAVMELLQNAELANDFILDATLAVVDTPLLLSDQLELATNQACMAVASLFDQQLAFADVVVLNKIDALGETALLRAEDQVRARAPNVRFLELAYQAQLDIRLALGLRLHQTTVGGQQCYTPVTNANAQPLANQRRLNGHSHSGMAAHGHGLATHKHFHEQDPGWQSFTLRSTAAQSTDKLQGALISAAQHEAVLRIKGFIRSEAIAQALLVQGVRGRITVSADATRVAPQKSELVFIGYHPSRSNVAALLSELTGTRWN